MLGNANSFISIDYIDVLNACLPCFLLFLYVDAMTNSICISIIIVKINPKSKYRW